MQSSVKQLQTPFHIGSDRIALECGCACVTAFQYVKAGDKVRWLNGVFHSETVRFPYWCASGVIKPNSKFAQEIRFQIGLPEKWCGRALQAGGGGLDGHVPPIPGAGLCYNAEGVLDAIGKGYAVFAGDGGHRSHFLNNTDCKWGLDRECFENFAWKQLKKVYDVAMVVIEAVYGERPGKTYFFGCSNGGRECLKAISLYPEDYDGAVCLYPAAYFTYTWLVSLRNLQSRERMPQRSRFTVKVAQAARSAIIDALDEEDGLKDGIVAFHELNPQQRARVEERLARVCDKEQMAYLTLVASDFKLPFELPCGEKTFPGHCLCGGVDLGFLCPPNSFFLDNVAKNAISCLALKAPGQSLDSFDPADHMQALQELSRRVDVDPRGLDRYFAAKKKLILLQGNMDMMVNPNATIHFYRRLQKRHGEALKDSLAFFYSPGYGHGFGGAWEFYTDLLGALEAWVEQGKRPEQFIGIDQTKGNLGRTRPIYEYPFYPAYTGKGDPNDAASFVKKALF